MDSRTSSQRRFDGPNTRYLRYKLIHPIVQGCRDTWFRHNDHAVSELYLRHAGLFADQMSSVLTCPPYLVAGVISIYWSYQSGKFNERTWHITAAKAVAVFGFVLAAATLNTGARYFAMCVFAIGTYAVNSIILGWVSSTCGQTKEEKACSLAIVNTIANASFIWTPVR